MTDQTNEEFRKLADRFIQLANEHYQESGDGRVGYALMYAAARFNAFLVATTAGHRSELIEEKEESMEYFTDQYQKMFSQNFDDYVEHFDQYL